MQFELIHVQLLAFRLLFQGSTGRTNRCCGFTYRTTCYKGLALPKAGSISVSLKESDPMAGGKTH